MKNLKQYKSMFWASTPIHIVNLPAHWVLPKTTFAIRKVFTLDLVPTQPPVLRFRFIAVQLSTKSKDTHFAPLPCLSAHISTELVFLRSKTAHKDRWRSR